MKKTDKKQKFWVRALCIVLCVLLAASSIASVIIYLL